MSESDLYARIVEVAKKLGLIALRLNSGKVPTRGGWMQLCPVGTPDAVIFGPCGQALFLEAKVEGKDLSPAQKEFRAKAARLGHVVERVVTEADVVRAVKEHLQV